MSETWAEIVGALIAYWLRWFSQGFFGGLGFALAVILTFSLFGGPQ